MLLEKEINRTKEKPKQYGTFYRAYKYTYLISANDYTAFPNHYSTDLQNKFLLFIP